MTLNLTSEDLLTSSSTSSSSQQPLPTSPLHGESGTTSEDGVTSATLGQCPDFSEADSLLLVTFSFWVEGVLQTGLASLGILGNCISCFVLTRKTMRNAFNLLLVTLGEAYF